MATGQRSNRKRYRELPDISCPQKGKFARNPFFKYEGREKAERGVGRRRKNGEKCEKRENMTRNLKKTGKREKKKRKGAWVLARNLKRGDEMGRRFHREREKT